MKPEATPTAVTLELIVWNDHGPLLATWLKRPHVARWWLDAEDHLGQMRATPEDGHAIIAVGGLPVGYIRWQAVSRETLNEAGLFEVPGGTIDVDLFVGEPRWLGRGVGTAALRLLLERLAVEGKAPLAGLCTSVENVASLRAAEKAGFHRLRQFDDPLYGRFWALAAALVDFKPRGA